MPSRMAAGRSVRERGGVGVRQDQVEAVVDHRLLGRALAVVNQHLGHRHVPVLRREGQDGGGAAEGGGHGGRVEVVGAHHAHARALLDVAMAVDAARQHPAAGGVHVAQARRQRASDGRNAPVAHAEVALDHAAVRDDAPAADRQVETFLADQRSDGGFHEGLRARVQTSGSPAPVRSTIRPVVLGPAVLGEVEDVLAEVLAQRHVGLHADHLVFLGERARHDLARGRDDGGAADHVVAVLRAALGGRGHPDAVLVGIGLQRHQVRGGAQVHRLVPVDVERRRVVAQHHHLGALQRHHAVGLGPAAVVAQAHAEARTHGVEHAKAQVAHLEELLFQVLEGRLGLVVRVARQVDLAVLADDGAGTASR
jgi:hypothetical protein